LAYTAHGLTGSDATMRFEGTSTYIATDDLKLAVNAAMRLRCSVVGRPCAMSVKIRRVCGACLHQDSWNAAAEAGHRRGSAQPLALGHRKRDAGMDP
ncbi:MAG: hypothetical protein EBW47_06045, partial [Betaproteobacteria bacterium]|nr:hypothetical protein [Betaproteobacteria bacterium]